MPPQPGKVTARGQSLVLFVIALVALVSMTALIVDGGNAYTQQRFSQNASDAATEAGATVLAQSLLSTAGGGAAKTDADVLAAMNASASANGIRPFGAPGPTNSVAYYTDIGGSLLTPLGLTTTVESAAARVGAGAIPPCAANCIGNRAVGVRAGASRDFSTYLAGLLGISRLTATTTATAVTGYSPTSCDPTQDCAILPVTFATVPATCDNSGNSVYGVTPWVPATPPYTSANEVILSLCKKGSGAFGWLDLGGGNLETQITNPSYPPIPVPTWLQTKPGNMNNVQTALSAFYGNIVGTYEPTKDLTVLIPFFDATCNTDRPDNQAPVFPGPNGPFPGVCSGGTAGNGNNLYYHIPYFIGFILDHAYVQGNNFPECNMAPGTPLPGGNGSGGCFKGWFARVVGPPGPVQINPGSGGPNTPLSIQLIK